MRRSTRTKAKEVGIIEQNVKLDESSPSNERKLPTNRLVQSNFGKGSNPEEDKKLADASVNNDKNEHESVVNEHCALQEKSTLSCITSSVSNADSSDKSAGLPPLAIPTTQTIARIEYRVKEVVWAKLRGHPHWPAFIKSFPTDKTAEVVWFNDYRRTKIFRTQMFKFLKHFDQFAVKFDDCVGLKTAAQEGFIYFGNGMHL